jgi:hypothetical protein
MGFAISWVAIKGLGKAEIYERLGMAPTGEIGDITGRNGASALDNDWTVVVLDKIGHPLALEPELRQLSRQCDVIACHIEEHTMFSTSEAWKDGDLVWQVVHEADSDILHLEAEGDLPPFSPRSNAKIAHNRLPKARLRRSTTSSRYLWCWPPRSRDSSTTRRISRSSSCSRGRTNPCWAIGSQRRSRGGDSGDGALTGGTLEFRIV